MLQRGSVQTASVYFPLRGRQIVMYLRSQRNALRWAVDSSMTLAVTYRFGTRILSGQLQVLIASVDLVKPSDVQCIYEEGP